MATGKSTVGQALASVLGWQFIDLDNLIELRQKRTISDIFAKDGEAYFRSLETRVLKEVAQEKKFVVGCGGGIVLKPENFVIMKRTGHIVCLQATADIIIKRTEGTTHRPLLNAADPHQRVEFLMKMRAPYYAKADMAVDTSALTVSQVVSVIKQKVFAADRIVHNAKAKTKRRIKAHVKFGRLKKAVLKRKH